MFSLEVTPLNLADVESPHQTPLPGLEEGKRLRDAGLAAADAAWLENARGVATWFCEHYGHVTTDDLHDALEEPRHVNHWGAILKDSRFTCTGYQPSTRPEAHARIIGTWKLRGGE